MKRTALIAAIALVDLAVVVYLAGSVVAAAMFIAFVLCIVVPPVFLARRVAPMPVAALIVIVAAVPWFFLRKASGVPVIVDVVTAALGCGVAATALKSGGWRRRTPNSPGAILPLLVPILFALVWLGWHVAIGNEVRFYGLFGIDFGNLVSVISTLRDSPTLPLSFVSGMGSLSYHWLYFTIPAALADFGGGSMPNANALALANLLAAMLLVWTVTSIAEKRAAMIVLFAPFTTYFYQAAAARLPLGPLALPLRNHLLLSPLNSMLVFGNNSVALVLAIVALTQLERWNRDGRMRDLAAGCLALAAVIGYSVTLLFPLTLALMLWTLAGRVRRPLIALPVAAGIGAIVVAIFFALHVIGGESTRHIAVEFDRGQFLRMIVFGLVPLWGTALLAARRELTIFHAVIASCIAVPTMLYVAGSPTGATDLSMKIASLLAVLFAPLLVIDVLDGWRTWAAALLIAFGVIQSATYLLQFSYYRLRHVTTNGVAVPRDYAGALAWVRDHTPPSAIVVDPHELPNGDEVFTLVLAERRIWLPTAYTRAVLINVAPAAIAQREALWRAVAERRDPAAAASIAAEADVLVAPFPITSPAWRPVHGEGAWMVYRSTLRR